MGAFIVAGIIAAVGVAGFFIGVLAYMSLPAPSVQGNASAPFWWLGSCLVLAALIAGSHWLPHIGW
jgi:hypothetical protein